MRAKQLMPARLEGRQSAGGGHAACQRLLEVYSSLAENGEHLFGSLLSGQAPRQWIHCPPDDAIDLSSGFQWFYHSHTPQGRPGSVEHVRIHLFARRKLWARRLRSAAALKFAALAGDASPSVSTRHLLGIGFDAKGIPQSLFTVNSWVTGDQMLSAQTTERLLKAMLLATGHALTDGVIACVVKLCMAEIQSLLQARDQTLFSRQAPGLLQDKSLEVLSEASIDLDAKLHHWLTPRV